MRARRPDCTRPSALVRQRRHALGTLAEDRLHGTVHLPHDPQVIRPEQHPPILEHSQEGAHSIALAAGGFRDMPNTGLETPMMRPARSERDRRGGSWTGNITRWVIHDKGHYHIFTAVLISGSRLVNTLSNIRLLTYSGQSSWPASSEGHARRAMTLSRCGIGYRPSPARSTTTKRAPAGRTAAPLVHR